MSVFYSQTSEMTDVLVYLCYMNDSMLKLYRDSAMEYVHSQLIEFLIRYSLL